MIHLREKKKKKRQLDFVSLKEFNAWAEAQQGVVLWCCKSPLHSFLHPPLLQTPSLSPSPVPC